MMLYKDKAFVFNSHGIVLCMHVRCWSHSISQPHRHSVHGDHTKLSCAFVHHVRGSSVMVQWR